MKNYKLSVIIPCYKVEKYLPKCLDSLMNQTDNNIEAICINDGSPDNCLSILKDYKNKYGDKIVIIDKKNEGVWNARQDGIKVAKGEYVGFLDSDDYVELNFVERMYSTAKEKNADIVICGFDRIDLETMKLYSREMTKTKFPEFSIKEKPDLLLEINGAPWNKIFKAELLKKMPKLKNIPPVLDDMMFQQLLFINADKIVFIPDSLNRYMVRKDSIINTVKPELIKPTYESMKEVRKLYEQKNNIDLLYYIDVNAFLHLGISLMYRLYSTKNIDFKKILNDNIIFLDKEFPYWRNNPYIKIKHIKNNKNANLKLWAIKQSYNLKLFIPFLKAYTFMIEKIGIDIKW